MKRVRTYRGLPAQTPVDEFEVREYPSVLFLVDDNIWIESIVRYLVESLKARSVKTRLIKKML